MQHILKGLPALIACALMSASSARAQDALMAKGNAQLTLSSALSNRYGAKMSNQLGSQDHTGRMDYDISFSRPLSFTLEYAITTATTMGLNVNTFRFAITEEREDNVGIRTAATSGKHMDIHLRAVRYFYSTPGSALYVIGEIGLRKRSITYAGNSDAAYINTFPETTKGPYNPLSWDYGVGFKLRLIKQVGISAEGTMLGVRFGLFYIQRPAGRRSKDQIGW
jgi:hypothetical protein